jgi:serine/threonine protein kinase
MPRKLRQDDIIHGWRILHDIHVGPLAMSYAALNDAGLKSFLKLYKSPTRTISWYQGFMDHQVAIHQRIERGPARAFTVRRFSGFEAEFGAAAVAYFQAFEFVEGGMDLESVTADIRSPKPRVSWPQRILMAKVLMAGVQALHDSGVVHGDLKPANVQVFPDSSIVAGYRLKLIDLDYAVLPDRLAPWHGRQGYVGTPGYYSPEHLKGMAPAPASDVFTCGIMLHELLTNHGNPFYGLSDEDYRRATNEWKAPEARLAGKLKRREQGVVEIIRQCLHPDYTKRPTAAEVLAVLNSCAVGGEAKSLPAKAPRSSTETPKKSVPASPKSPTARSAARPKKDQASQEVPTISPTKTTPNTAKGATRLQPPVPAITLQPAPGLAPSLKAATPQPALVRDDAPVSPRPAPAPVPPRPIAFARPSPIPPSQGLVLHLVSLATGATLQFRIPTDVGRRLLEKTTLETRAANELQFRLAPHNDASTWTITPYSDTKNQTLVNGRAISQITKLNPGDHISVGNEVTGAQRHVLRVEYKQASSAGSIR